jgi:hypothetical protein
MHFFGIFEIFDFGHLAERWSTEGVWDGFVRTFGKIWERLFEIWRIWGGLRFGTFGAESGPGGCEMHFFGIFETFDFGHLAER